MFNENIDELHDIIPSIAIIRLCCMVRDIYKHSNTPNMLNEVDMQKLYINYGDKYNPIDKVILLIYGVTSISDYRIDEESIPIDRINKETLSEKEKELYDKGELKELTTPKVILNSNVGTVVIGYDYAYVRKEEYTPNVEITDEQKIILEDTRLSFNINYPYISIDPYNNILCVSPIISYKEFTMEEAPKHSIDKYIIDVNRYNFQRIYSKQPYTKYEDYKIIDIKPDKILNIDGWEYKQSLLKNNDKKETMIIEYTKDDKLFQFIIPNDYSMATISYEDNSGEYIYTKSYFINHDSE